MNVWQLVLVILGNTGFYTLVQALIQARTQKKGLLSQIMQAIEGLKKQMKKHECDSCRTQLLLLISDYPHERQEILYASSIFRSWLRENNIPEPYWLGEKDKKEK